MQEGCADMISTQPSCILSVSLSGCLNGSCKVLKNRLKECIQQGEAHAYLEPAIRFADFSTLIDYIEATHEKYLNKLRSVEEDIRFILNMCFQVVQGLIQICIGNKNFAGAIQAA